MNKFEISNTISLPVLSQLSDLLLDKRITEMSLPSYDNNWIEVDSSNIQAQTDLGIKLIGFSTRIFVKHASRKIGDVVITNSHSVACSVFFHNDEWSGRLYCRMRISGANSMALFSLQGQGVITLLNVWLRSAEQIFFWGRGATAVNLAALEIEGKGAIVAVGDDALISSGINIRNFDMHAIVDLKSGAVLNKPVNTVLEFHVWLGLDVALLNCERICYGSVIGARSLVKGVIPAKVIAAGTPARVIATEKSWGRSISGISSFELNRLVSLDEEFGLKAL